MSSSSDQKPPATTGDDDSKSDDAMCGSSVAMTEAEEDNASYAMSVATAPHASSASSRLPKGLILTKDSSLEISINNTPVDVSDAIADEDDHGNAAPMHFHVLRTPARLKGAPGRSRSSSRSRPGSRRNSASPIRGGGGTLSGLDMLKTPGGANSAGGGAGSAGAVGGSSPAEGMSGSSSLADLNDLSEHSHTGYVNPDILLDKLGFRDLDPNVSQAEMQELLMKHLSSNSSLPTLNERMSEETMEDVHAFQDLVFVKKSSDGSGASAKKMKRRVSPVKGPGVGVAAATAAEEDALLEEGDEEDEDDESSDDGKAARRASKLTLNTLDEAAEEEEDEEDEEGDEETGDDDEEEPDDDAANKQISPPSSISGDENDDTAVGEGNLGKAGSGAEVDLHNLMSELDLSNARREGQSSPSNARVSTMAVASNGIDFDLDAEEDNR